VNGRTILVVDDHAENREVYALILEHFGYDVLTAADGRQAVEQALTHLPDLILMDLSMPVLDGLEATELLKQNDSTHHIPILVVSAHDEPQLMKRALAAGVAGYILKPAPPATVLTRIESCLQGADGDATPTSRITAAPVVQPSAPATVASGIAPAGGGKTAIG
jgi:CheY-like chemotaxis protein